MKTKKEKKRKILQTITTRQKPSQPAVTMGQWKVVVEYAWLAC